MRETQGLKTYQHDHIWHTLVPNYKMHRILKKKQFKKIRTHLKHMKTEWKETMYQVGRLSIRVCYIDTKV